MDTFIHNIAIIAHVDHGKTTLVDAMLKQTRTFRENQQEFSQSLIMDKGDLEKEKGITILAKNTAVSYKDHKINIIDTPGHADFGGEVERTLGMASAAILLVDAAEGPLPQTKFVLQQALRRGLKIILLINKIDKKDARPLEIKSQVEDLFLSLATDDSSLEFVTLYGVGRDGKVFTSLPENYNESTVGSLDPLFDTILEEVPSAHTGADLPFQMAISTLDFDNYVGKICIGKVNQGTLTKGANITLLDEQKKYGNFKVSKLYTFQGLEKVEVEQVVAGDIVAIAGISDMTIGQTVTDPSNPQALPTIKVEEPTIKLTIGPNTSPFSGKEGTLLTSRQIKERLQKEIETNLGLKVEENPDGVDFIVFGRGELHLAVLVETMRREGFELQVSRPQVVLKVVDGRQCEPYEEVTVEVDSSYTGAVSEEFGSRKALLQNMVAHDSGTTTLVYKISSANLLGIRGVLMTKTRGTAQLSTFFLGYEALGSRAESARNGALVASQSGTAMTYGLINSQDRGILFVSPQEPIYEGQVVGLCNRPMDLELNVCKAKQLTNNRSSGEGVAEGLTPATILSLEESLDFLADDELLEVTPKALRLRKKLLTLSARQIAARRG